MFFLLGYWKFGIGYWIFTCSPAHLLYSLGHRPSPIIVPTSAKVAKKLLAGMMGISLSAYLEMIKKNLKNSYFVVYPPARLCAQMR
jgi:hypothetical protein